MKGNNPQTSQSRCSRQKECAGNPRAGLEIASVWRCELPASLSSRNPVGEKDAEGSARRV